MHERLIATVVVGFVAASSVLFTSYVVPVPIWALFLAWAAHAAAGGGAGGIRKSLPATLLGVAGASGILLVADSLGGSAIATAVCVTVGAGALVAIGEYKHLDFTPAAFVGCATTVAITTTSGHSIASLPFASNPAVIAVSAMILGAAYGYVADLITGRVQSRFPAVAPAILDLQ